MPLGESSSKVLQKKYPKIVFESIPESWICLLDEYLSLISFDNIEVVAQKCGRLIISYKTCKLSERDFLLLEKYEKLLYSADQDIDIEMNNPSKLN